MCGFFTVAEIAVFSFLVPALIGIVTGNSLWRAMHEALPWGEFGGCGPVASSIRIHLLPVSLIFCTDWKAGSCIFLGFLAVKILGVT